VDGRAHVSHALLVVSGASSPSAVPSLTPATLRSSNRCPDRRAMEVLHLLREFIWCSVLGGFAIRLAPDSPIAALWVGPIIRRKFDSDWMTAATTDFAKSLSRHPQYITARSRLTRTFKWIFEFRCSNPGSQRRHLRPIFDCAYRRIGASASFARSPPLSIGVPRARRSSSPGPEDVRFGSNENRTYTRQFLQLSAASLLTIPRCQFGAVLELHLRPLPRNRNSRDQW